MCIRDSIYVNEAVAVNAGHGSVHLGHHQIRALQRSLDDIHTDAQAEISAGIGQRQGDQSHINRHLPAPEKRRQIGQKNGGIICLAPVDGFTGMVADKKGVVPEIMFQFFIRIGSHAQSPHLQNLGIKKSFRMGFYIIHQSADQVLRFAATGRDEYAVTRMNMTKNIISGSKFFRIPFLQLFKHL